MSVEAEYTKLQLDVLDALAYILKGVVQRDEMDIQIDPKNVRAYIILRNDKKNWQFNLPDGIPWFCQVYAPGMFPNEGTGSRTPGISYRDPKTGNRIWEDCDKKYPLGKLFDFRKEIIASAQYVLSMKIDSSQK